MTWSKMRPAAKRVAAALDVNPFAIGAGVATVGLAAYACLPANYPPKGLAQVVKTAPDFIRAGCGDKEYLFKGTRPDGAEVDCSFPADVCPEALPDLSKHSNFMAEEMVRNPEFYEKLKGKKTKMGVTLAKCMKTGVDNPGHPAIKTVGLVAGDEESYEMFKELFDPVIDKRHKGYPAHARHHTDLDHKKLSTTKIDPTCDAEGQCKYVLTSRVRTGRSVRGMRLPPAIGFEERRELERVVVKGLLKMEGELKGDYYPLHGSKSYKPKPSGMSLEMEEELRSGEICSKSRIPRFSSRPGAVGTGRTLAAFFSMTRRTFSSG
jgi:creatine kinase